MGLSIPDAQPALPLPLPDPQPSTGSDRVVRILLDSKLRLVEANDAARQLLRLPANRLLARLMWRLWLSRHGRIPWLEAFVRGAQTGQQQAARVSYAVGQEHRQLEVRALAAKGRGPEGKSLLVSLECHKVEPAESQGDARQLLKESEEKRRSALQEVQRFSSILEHLTAGVTVVDSSRRVVFRNRQALEITGLGGQTAELLSNTVGAGIYSISGEKIPEDFLPAARLLRGDKVESEEHVLQRPDGSRRRVVASGSSITCRGEQLAIVSFQDVTDLRALEQRREEHLQIMSHDLRTPLAVIVGGAQFICMESKDERTLGHARAVLSAGRKITAMLEDLVLSAGVEHQRVSLDLARSDLVALFQSNLQYLSQVLDTSRVALDVQSTCCPTVHADPYHLGRVFTNLLTNALQYSEPGSQVKVSVWAEDGEVITSIADQGPGIAPDDLLQVFRPHYRGETARARAPGTGLGLFIVKGLVEAHGGRVWVESTPGKGSTFYFALPVDVEGTAKTAGV